MFEKLAKRCVKQFDSGSVNKTIERTLKFLDKNVGIRAG